MKKKQKMNFLVLSVSAALLLASCGPRLYYSYNYVRYDTPEPALEAQKKDLEVMTSNIKATESPVGGSVTVVIPSKAYLKKTVVVWKGAEPSLEMKEKAFDFNATLMNNNYRAMGSGVEKRRIFNRVTIISSDDPEDAAFSEEIALKLYKKDYKLQWFLYKKKTEGPPAVKAIEEVPPSLPPLIRMNLWLERVENAAKGGQ